MVSSLQEHLVATNLLPYKGKLFHGRYAARVFNLIVQEGFKAMSGATSSIRDSVKYVKSSQARKQRFEEMIEQVGISCEKRPPLMYLLGGIQPISCLIQPCSIGGHLKLWHGRTLNTYICLQLKNG